MYGFDINEASLILGGVLLFHGCLRLLAFIWEQNIVADMRKVLAKNPQVEQQKLHRRVFLDNVDRENQALLVSYLSVTLKSYLLH